MLTRKPDPSDVSDAEWAFVAPSLTLMPEQAPQRKHSLRDIFNGLRWLVRPGAPWRRLPHDLPPWEAVYQQTQRWRTADCFEAIGQGSPASIALLFACVVIGAGRESRTLTGSPPVDFESTASTIPPSRLQKPYHDIGTKLPGASSCHYLFTLIRGQTVRFYAA